MERGAGGEESTFVICEGGVADGGAETKLIQRA